MPRLRAVYTEATTREDIAMMLNVLMLVAGVFLAFWLVGNALGFLMMLLVAALVGLAAEALVPGKQLEHGWLGAIGAGLVGSWLGSSLLGPVGPVLMNVPLIPALVGAVLVCVLVAMLRRTV